MEARKESFGAEQTTRPENILSQAPVKPTLLVLHQCPFYHQLYFSQEIALGDKKGNKQNDVGGNVILCSK